MEKLKQSKNLFKKLIKDENVYFMQLILLNNARKSFYKKIRSFKSFTLN